MRRLIVSAGTLLSIALPLFAQTASNTTLVGFWPSEIPNPGERQLVLGQNHSVCLNNGWTLDFSDSHTICPYTPSGPMEIGEPYDRRAGVAVVQDTVAYALVSSGEPLVDELRIINVSAPQNPVLIGVFEFAGGMVGLAVRDDYAFIAIGPGAGTSGGLLTVDVSNPGAPLQISFLEIPGDWDAGGWTTHSFAHVDDFVYLQAHPVFNYGSPDPRAVFIFDVSDPWGQATITGFLSGWGKIYTAANEGSATVVFASEEDNRVIHMLDVSDVFSPHDRGAIGNGMDIAVQGEYVYVAGGSDGLRVYHFVAGHSPAEVGYYRTKGEAYSVVADSAFVYVWANDGLYILQNNLAVGIEGEDAVPLNFTLAQNYPNPFNPTTTISYALPKAADVTLTVVDVLGRQVRELASGTRPAGTHEVAFDATGLPSGVYFYRLQAGDYVETKRMVVVK